MEIIIPLLFILVVAIVAIWLINQIPFPSGLEIIRTVLIVIIVILALEKVLKLW